MVGVWIGGIVAVVFGIDQVSYFLPDQQWKNSILYAGLLLLIGIPVLGVILAVLRVFFNYRTPAGWQLMMVLAWVCSFSAMIWLAADTTTRLNAENAVSAETSWKSNQMTVEALGGHGNTQVFSINDLKFRGDMKLNSTELSLGMVSLRIKQSRDEQFHLEEKKESRGYTRQQALALAQDIDYEFTREGDHLILDDHFSLPKGRKFRGQHVELSLSVPVGGKLVIQPGAVEMIEDIHWVKGFEETDLSGGIELEMTAAGMKPVQVTSTPEGTRM